MNHVPELISSSDSESSNTSDEDGEEKQSPHEFPCHNVGYRCDNDIEQAFMAEESSSNDFDSEARSGFPWQAVVDSGASTFIMKHPPDHFTAYKGRKSQIEIAKQDLYVK